jgi:hypothetical protein
MFCAVTVPLRFAVSVSIRGWASPFTVTDSDTCPISSVTLSALDCSEMTPNSLMVFVLNPCFSVVMVNLLGGRPLKLKTPPSPLLVVYFCPVSSFCSVTVAPTTASPCGSVTIPWIDARYCACAAVARKTVTRVKKIARTKYLVRSITPLHPYRFMP